MSTLPFVKRSLVLVVLAGVLLLPALVQGQAPATSAEVDVRDVQFSKVRAPRGGGNWLEAVIELNVRANTGAGVYGRWADRVEVELSIGIERRDGGFSFYRSGAELVAIEAGKANVRFYLPAEIVRREQIGSSPYAYVVKVTVPGAPKPAGRVSSVLQAPGALKSFEDRVLQAADRNDGVLVPQYESPFEREYGGDTPSFVRRRG